MKPQIVLPNYEGTHNTGTESITRLKRGAHYQDVSTAIICPTRGMIPAKVVQNWLNLMRPMNQVCLGPIFAIGMEVGHAYNYLVDIVLTNMPKMKYILTIEEDNMPPPDGLLKLYEGMKKYDVVGGLYWTKGEQGQPMIYGDPKKMPLSFAPLLPETEKIQACNGLGMGFTLFKTEIFKDKRIKKPWFKTDQSYQFGVGTRGYTQDLYFFEKLYQLGYKVASDNRVRVGHYDVNEDKIW